jgi:hypothetical protein
VFFFVRRSYVCLIPAKNCVLLFKIIINEAAENKVEYNENISLVGI